MNTVHALTHAVGSERGAVLPWFVLWLPVLVLFVVFVVDVGHWFEHKRHLQLQADAGALAGGGVFTIPCSDANIDATARQYAGDPDANAPYNTQVPPTEPANVHVLINSTRFWNEGGTNYSDGGGPCATKMVDVKITEADLPLFFRIPGLFGSVDAINARARVSIESLSYLGGGSLPIAVPDVDPSRAAATFVNEDTGEVLATTPLTASGVANGLALWDNAAAPVSVPVSASNIGVRITLSGSSGSMTCGAPLVACYDMGSQNGGVLYVRGWSGAGTGGGANPPLVRDATLIPGTCADPYFVAETSACTIGVSAVVDFGTIPPSAATVTATLAGRSRDLTYDATSGRWVSTGTNFLAIDPATGPQPVTLSYQVRSPAGGPAYVVGGVACSPRCSGTLGAVQRSFAATEDRTGPIKLAQVWKNSLFWANSHERGTTQELVVKIGITPNLQNATDVNDPIVTLRVVGGSRNQSLDCEPPNYPGSTISKTNLWEELAYGCGPSYTPNTGTACPATAGDLWASAEPWKCVAVQTGSATNQVPRGLNLRILGDEKPTTCTSPNNWRMFPNIPPGDPRVLNVFITPFGSFSGSGSGVVPVTKLGTFYVTGWTAGGSGFRNPCQGNGDDPVPNNDAGNIVGHFIKYVFGLNNGGGSGQTCDFDAFGSCIAVLTE